jgi:hypothetical protein
MLTFRYLETQDLAQFISSVRQQLVRGRRQGCSTIVTLPELDGKLKTSFF